MTIRTIAGSWACLIGLGGMLVAAAPPEEKPKVDVAVRILTELSIAQIALEVEPFTKWARPIIEKWEKRFGDEDERPRDVVLQITMHPKGPADAELSAAPPLTDAQRAAILKEIDLRKAPQSKVVDFSFRLVAKIRGGNPDASLALSPPLDTPDEKRVERFEKAATAERIAMLKRWATSDAVPVLSAFASNVDPKFAGVRALGKMLGGVDASKPIDVDRRTERNTDYWRAFIEMISSDPLVPAARISLHVANGELDKARRLLEIETFFDGGKSGASRLLGDLRVMLNLFHAGVDSQIRKGIALHDLGKFDEALAAYDAVLKDYPQSAWAHYERFHTRRARLMKQGKSVDEVHADWPKVWKTILACDPLYPNTAITSGGKEEMFRLFRRMETIDLFQGKTQEEIPAALLKYADVAFDLDEFGIAATLYWHAVVALDAKARDKNNLIEEFLYCLNRLGLKQLQENFKADHAAAFAKIEKERRERIDASPAGKAFAK